MYDNVWGRPAPGETIPKRGDYIMCVGRYAHVATAKNLARFGPQHLYMQMSNSDDTIWYNDYEIKLLLDWGRELDHEAEIQMCLMPSGKFQLYPAPTPYGIGVGAHVEHTEPGGISVGQTHTFNTANTYDHLYKLVNPNGPVVHPMEQDADHNGVIVYVTPEDAKSDVPGFRFIMPSGPNPMQYWIRNRCGDGLNLLTASGNSLQTFSDGSDQTLKSDSTAYVVWDPLVDMHSVHTISYDTKMKPSAAVTYCSLWGGHAVADVTQGVQNLSLTGQWAGSRAVRIIVAGHPVATYAAQYPGHHQYRFSVHLDPEQIVTLSEQTNPSIPLRITVDHQTVVSLSIPVVN